MPKPPAIRDILARTEAYFREKHVDSPRLSAQLLVAKGLGLDRMGLFLDLDRPLTERELAGVRPLVARRGKGEPAAYILGTKEFYGLEFLVSSAVLIPRPETECIVDTVLALFPPDASPDIADLGTGSGCLAVTLAARLPRARLTALDASAPALAQAARNAAHHDLEARITFVNASFQDLPIPPDGFDCIVANPPYVSEAEFADLSREVADFEPKAALVPGPTGLEAFPAVIAAARCALKPGGSLLMEIGWKQAEAVRAMLEAPDMPFEAVAVRKDLAGHDRVVSARRTSE